MSARTIWIGAALVLFALTLAIVSSRSLSPSPATALVASTSGGLVLTDSLQGSPVVSAAGVTPGVRRRGLVRIRNVTRRRLPVALVRRRLSDVPGAYGGRLSRVLVLRVTRIRRQGRVARSLYRGRLDRMPRVAIGSIGAGKSRRYRFSLTFPDGGTPPSSSTGDNAYQGSALSVDFVWLAAQP